MSKILTVGEMVEVVNDLDTNAVEERDDLIREMEQLTRALGEYLAERFNVTFYGVMWGDEGFMGSFRTGPNGEQPELLGNVDIDGDWD